MNPRYKPQQVLFAINIYHYKDNTYQQDFFCIEKVIIDTINIDVNGIDYWVKSSTTGIEWGDSLSEDLLFTTKELAAKHLLKLCGL